MGRLDDIGEEAFPLLSSIRKVYDNFGFSTKIMGASIRHPLHVEKAALIGLDAITIPYSVLRKMYYHPLTTQGIKDFEEDNCSKPLYE